MRDVKIVQRDNGNVKFYNKETKTFYVDKASLILGFISGIITSIIGGLIIKFFL